MQQDAAACTVFVCNDAMAVLAAGTDDSLDGIALVAGTGCIAIGKHGGEVARAGGWGPAFCEEGGGLWLSQQALKHAAACHDVGRSDQLFTDVLEAAGVGNAHALLGWAYSHQAWAHIATLAPAVMACASKGAGAGSAAAERIVASAADAAVSLVVQVRARLQRAAQAHTGMTTVVLAGGLVADKSSAYSAALRCALVQQPGVQLVWCVLAARQRVAIVSWVEPDLCAMTQGSAEMACRTMASLHLACLQAFAHCDHADAPVTHKTCVSGAPISCPLLLFLQGRHACHMLSERAHCAGCRKLQTRHRHKVQQRLVDSAWQALHMVAQTLYCAP